MKSMKTSFMYAIFALLIFLLIWNLTARFSGWSEQIFPEPLAVLFSLIELLTNGTLIKHAVASLFRVTAGFYLAIILGIPLGMCLGRCTSLRLLVNPIIHFLRPISPLAWIPLSMLWFGIGDLPAIFLIFLSSFFPLLVATTIAVRSINPIYFQVATNFNFSRFETFTKIMIPATIPAIVTALRLSITIAWLVVVAAEMIAVQSGLGYLILDSRNALRMDYVMVGMVVIGMIGLALDYIMRKPMQIESVAWDAPGSK